MRPYAQKLKKRILLLFLPPVLGLLYFSGLYVYESFQRYHDSLYLAYSIRYVRHAMNVIENLQKERGFSIACLGRGLFCKALAKQRKRSDKAVKQYENFLLTNSSKLGPTWQEILNETIKKFAILATLRMQVDRKEINPTQLLSRYSAIIQQLIETTTILDKNFVDEEFSKMVLAFDKIAQFAELNGQERALVLFLLQKPAPDPRIYKKAVKLELQAQSIHDLLDKIMPLSVRVLYQKRIPASLENIVKKTKKEILEYKKFDLLKETEWWQLETEYIRRLFRIQKDLLSLAMHKQNQLKKEAFNSLVVSGVVWVAALLGFILFLRHYETLLGLLVRRLRAIEMEKRLYRLLAEFSENLFFIQNSHALINALVLLLNKSGYFDFLFLRKCDKNEVIATQNIPARAVEQLWPKSLEARLQNIIKEKKAQIFHSTFDHPALKEREILAVPIFHNGECLYALIGVAEYRHQIPNIVLDIAHKMVELFDVALTRMQKIARQRELQSKLDLMSQAFETHEAIAITDKTGNILKVNKAFEQITGYKEEEVIGKNPSILKSGKHDKEFYQQMWEDIKKRGSWKGEIYNKRKDGTIYPEILSITAIKDEQGKIRNYVSHFFDISDLKKAEEEIRRRADTDLLTDLFNRKKLLEELQILHAILKKEGSYGAFFFIDVDNFKYINDSYGHDVGDKVLIEVANRLKSLATSGDICARIAGDEFALVLSDIGKDQQEAVYVATVVAQKLIQEQAEPIIVDDLEIEISYSVGIYIFPGEEKSVDEVITMADMAMYSAKKTGKNMYTFYNESLNMESKQFLIMKKAIENGLKTGEFKLFFQPKLHLKSGKVVGFEGLLRWQSDQGVVYPDQFLPYARGNRLIYMLHDLVVEEAFEMLKALQKRKSDVKVAINISADLIVNEKYMHGVVDKIRNFDLAHNLVLEITEDVLVQNVAYVKELIAQLKELGVGIAIDDFGVGYSSLSYLREFSVDELKIDKSFVLDLFEDKNDKLVQKIIEIAKIYGIRVTAEGVESAQAIEFLKSIDCDYIQGFYFSRALPKEKALKVL